MLRFSRRRLLHAAAHLLAVFLSLGVFFVSLLLIEAIFYAVTGHPVSMAALVLAALVAALTFLPLVRTMQHGLDRVFFRQYVDALEAIRHLGAGDLAELPAEGIEQALLARICMVSHRPAAALVEKGGENLHIRIYPDDYAAGFAPLPDPSLHLAAGSPFELCLEIPSRQGRAWLYLGMHDNGMLTDEDEIEALRGLSRFAAMSLEHARLTRKQAESARLDSLSRVAGQLHSHDLKNRLNDLSFLAHHIGSGKLDAEDVERLMASIRKVVGRMQTVMQRLADPQAPLHPKLAPLDVRQMLARAVEERLWPEGVQVVQEIPELPPVSGDEVMLSGVFENLFDNAVQAMQRKGELHISTTIDDACVEVLVRDDGCGMSASFLNERAFRLFSTSKPSGLGIGLYLSKRIVEAHQGKIWAESAGEGKGCTFHVRLPLWHARAERES
jgi:signal transduction histidine kinase